MTGTAVATFLPLKKTHHSYAGSNLNQLQQPLAFRTFFFGYRSRSSRGSGFQELEKRAREFLQAERPPWAPPKAIIVMKVFFNVFLMVSQTGWVWRMWVSPTWHSWHLVILIIYIYI